MTIKATSIMNHVSARDYDPTRTTTLRNAFVRAMNKRFTALRGLIYKAIVTQNCFGYSSTPNIYQVSLPNQGAFAFTRSSDKIEAFMTWLRSQVDNGILDIGKMEQVGWAIEGAWTNMYVKDSYQRGVIRARAEMRKAGYAIPSIEQSGGLAVSMSAPFHMDRLGLLYTRVYSELRGITTAMDTQISRVLAQGMADGDNPRLLARKLNKTIFGKQGDLALTDTLGRFIPAQRRAQTLARTEVIRAHHQATIQEYKNWAMEGVKVKAEWSTAGFGVCPECAALEGKVFTLTEIQSMIPVHPNCRCMALPLEVGKTEVVKEEEKTVQIIGSNDTTKIQVANEIKTLLERNSNLSLKVKKASQQLNKVILDESTAPIGAVSDSNVAIYLPEERIIRLGKNSMKRMRSDLYLNKGNHTVATDFGSNIRHEYGHYIHSEILSNSQKDTWRLFFHENERLFKTSVSRYASTNAEEAFAETFSAYTSEYYGKKFTGGVLNRKIEDLFKLLIEK